MKGTKGRKVASPPIAEYGFTASNMDTFVKGHAHSLEYIKWRWFYAPAYRYTPAVCGAVIPDWKEER
ncbi:MAG: hypothetical protein J6U54_08560 [Clostridiales bacterium]|nr:hypothetical protein [Clostridiales bacterium]